jgi:hypothetical protein
MTNGTTRALTTAASVRGAEMSTSGQAALEVQSNKSADFGGWPLSWWTHATTGVLRTWGQFSQFGLQPADDPWRLRSLRRRRPWRTQMSIRRPAATGCFMPPWAESQQASRRLA